jgi:hypothetical protein
VRSSFAPRFAKRGADHLNVEHVPAVVIADKFNVWPALFFAMLKAILESRVHVWRCCDQMGVGFPLALD